MVIDREPLTVVQVDHMISQEEAQRIREAFTAAVPDGRPMLVLGPGTRAMELEPYQVALARSWVALWLAVASLVAAVIAIVLLLVVVL